MGKKGLQGLSGQAGPPGDHVEMPMVPLNSVSQVTGQGENIASEETEKDRDITGELEEAEGEDSGHRKA